MTLCPGPRLPALALGVSELAAGLFPSLPSLVEAIANWVIDSVPGPVKDWAISVFGTADKAVLIIGICVVTVVVGALVGLARPPLVLDRHCGVHRVWGVRRTRRHPGPRR